MMMIMMIYSKLKTRENAKRTKNRHCTQYSKINNSVVAHSSPHFCSNVCDAVNFSHISAVE